MNPRCPECGGKLICVPMMKRNRVDYVCEECKLSHRGDPRTMGLKTLNLVSREIRGLRNQAHGYFDKIWRSRIMRREEAYSWLAGQLKIEESKVHFKRQTPEQLRLSIQICQEFLEKHQESELQAQSQSNLQ